MPIELCEYTESWAQQFLIWKEWLYTVLFPEKDIIKQIEHVGSTSIPNLNCAKPILDIDIIVTKDQLPLALSRIEGLGFRNRGTCGIDDRYSISFIRSVDTNTNGSEVVNNYQLIVPPPYRSNVYIIVEGSAALQNHLTLKKVLSTNPDLAQRYAAVKKEIALTTDDVNTYAMSKTDIIAEILRAGNMDDESLQSIISCNTLK